jgi:hypothetical protein
MLLLSGLDLNLDLALGVTILHVLDTSLLALVILDQGVLQPFQDVQIHALLVDQVFELVLVFCAEIIHHVFSVKKFDQNRISSKIG